MKKPDHQQPRRSRRRVVRTAGIGIAVSIGGSTAVGSGRVTDDETSAEQYVAVVDRIVDDAFVVLLVEDDSEVVDQHVEPATEMDVEEGDILRVVIEDGEVLTYEQLEKRPGERADSGESGTGCDR